MGHTKCCLVNVSLSAGRCELPDVDGHRRKVEILHPMRDAHKGRSMAWHLTFDHGLSGRCLGVQLLTCLAGNSLRGDMTLVEIPPGMWVRGACGNFACIADVRMYPFYYLPEVREASHMHGALTRLIVHISRSSKLLGYVIMHSCWSRRIITRNKRRYCT